MITKPRSKRAENITQDEVDVHHWLRRANEKLRGSCYACGGYGCDLCGDLAPVIPLHPGHSVKVGA